MKKFLSFMVMGIIGILPLTVDAASEIKYSCGDFDANGMRTCNVAYVVDEASPQNSITVTLTEHGGADIQAINGVAGATYSINSQQESNGVWTVIMLAPAAEAGEHDLFTFTYKESGTEDCKVTISIGNDNKEVTTSTPDEPTDNVQTGSTLPYIALGTIALVAVGAYVITKNKSKMYKI